jgi:hypothetical protein
MDAPISVLTDLPANATNSEAIEWLGRMRRLVNRWDRLPDAANRSMTPDVRRLAERQLDKIEMTLATDMQIAH